MLDGGSGRVQMSTRGGVHTGWEAKVATGIGLLTTVHTECTVFQVQERLLTVIISQSAAKW